MMNEVDWWELETQHNDTVTRDELKTSLATAIARAEAADRLTAKLGDARRRIAELEIVLADAENRARMAEEDAAALRSGGETYAELYWRNRAEAAEAAEAGLREELAKTRGKTKDGSKKKAVL